MRLRRLFDNKCRSGSGQEGRIVCQIEFALKDVEAKELFTEAAAGLRNCLTKEITETRDLGVNHPDSYQAISFEMPSREVRLIYKDKSALQTTFITVRVFD